MPEKHVGQIKAGGISDTDIAASKMCLFHKKEQPDLEICIRRCNLGDQNKILSLQDSVYNNIKNKATFVMTTEDELSESLLQDICLGAFLDEELVAFTLMVANRYSTRNIGYYLGYDKVQSLICVTYDTTFVNPHYNGYGFQRFFIGQKDAIARELGAVEVLATVSPDNRVSLNNMLANDFVIIAEKNMYGGFERLVLRKSLVEIQ